MKKTELIQLIQDKGFNSKKEAEFALNSVFEVISENLSKEKKIAVPGFGTFYTTLQKGKTGKVPGTDKTYTTVDKIVPKFKAATALKDKVEMGK